MTTNTQQVNTEPTEEAFTDDTVQLPKIVPTRAKVLFLTIANRENEDTSKLVQLCEKRLFQELINDKRMIDMSCCRNEILYNKSITSCRDSFQKSLESMQNFDQDHNPHVKSHFDYVCILPCNYILNSGWIDALIEAHETFEDCGILSIRPLSDSDLKLSPMRKKSMRSGEGEDLEHVWVEEKNTVRGVMFMRAKYFLEKVKFTEAENIAGFEDDILSYQFAKNGLHNFYITGQSAIISNMPDYAMYSVKTAESYERYKKYIEADFSSSVKKEKDELAKVFATNIIL
jgi:hypothetical protein